MYGTDSALSEPSMDASLLVAPLAASETLQRLVAWRQALPGANAAAAEQAATAQEAAAAAAEEATEAEKAAGVALERKAALLAQAREKAALLAQAREHLRPVLRKQRTQAGVVPATPPTLPREERQTQRELGQVAEQAEALARAAEAAKTKAAVAEADRAAAEQRQRHAHEAEQARQAREATAAAAELARQAREAAAEAASQRCSVGQIFSALQRLGPGERAKVGGKSVPGYLLDCTFTSGVDDPACTDVQRRRLLAAAALLVHAVLELLAPAPLATAVALGKPPKSQAVHDPMRVALAARSEPTKAQRLKLLGESGVVQSLVHSYMAAVEREARTAEQPVERATAPRLYSRWQGPQLPPSPGRRAHWLSAHAQLALATLRWSWRRSSRHSRSRTRCASSTAPSS